MNDNDQPGEDDNSDEALLKRLRQFGEKALDGLFGSNKGNFDEKELASGSEDSLDKTDGEEFSEELEEKTPEERRKEFVSVDRQKKRD